MGLMEEATAWAKRSLAPALRTLLGTRLLERSQDKTLLLRSMKEAALSTQEPVAHMLSKPPSDKARGKPEPFQKLVEPGTSEL